MANNTYIGMPIHLNITLSQAQLDALKREYSKKGLGVDLPGNKPSFFDQVTKQIVEEAKKQHA